ncbi:MAG TPA: hypothetical protein VHI13_10540 [Candidatus Kapabacteria bacterium]|nr:hypothetical protein [Candidatus Kapabacteria bacterium]
MSDKSPLEIDPDLPFEEEAVKKKSYMLPGCLTGGVFYAAAFGAWVVNIAGGRFDLGGVLCWVPAAVVGGIIFYQAAVRKRRGFIQGALIAVGIGLLMFGLCIGLLSS